MMPAVVFKTSFVYSWNVGGFLEYIERPEAIKGKLKDKNAEIYDYLEYMGNDDKSDGLFSAEKDVLSKKDKAEIRKLEALSMEKGCPKYLGVISFDNEYLRQNGWIVGDTIDKERLKACTRKAITAFVNESRKLSADNVYWTVAIHTNTDNVHIHFQLLEKERLEDRRITYRSRGKDKLEIAAFERLRSAVISDTLMSKQTPVITEIERKILVPGITNSFSPTSRVKKLTDQLPESKKAWQYGRANMLPFRKEIKRCVDEIIESDEELKKAFEEYKCKLENMSRQYRELYGNKGNNRVDEYAVDRLDAFYNQAGNKLLQEIFKMRSELRADDHNTVEHTKQSHRPKNIRRYVRFKASRKLIYSINSSRFILDRCADTIEKMLRESEQHLKALQNEYEYQLEQGGLYDDLEKEY